MRWTTREIKYLEEHAGDGAAAIAAKLGRSKASVEKQAGRYGLSLRKRWHCPKCGHSTSKPLSNKTGWCAVCTMQQRREGIAEEVRQMEEEVRREESEKRARQRLYSRKNRAKKKLESMSKK